MEIDRWWDSEDRIHQAQVSLFIAALEIFQAMDITDKLSYYSVAGQMRILSFLKKLVTDSNQASMANQGCLGTRVEMLVGDRQITAKITYTPLQPGTDHIFFCSRCVLNAI